MVRTSIRRLVGSVPVLVVGSFVLFWASRSAFDPTKEISFRRDSAEQIAQRRAELGLDDPVVVQWWRWLSAFVRGDWGVSSSTGDEVLPAVGRALGVTLELIVWATALSVVVAIVIGVLSAARPYSWFDQGFTGLSYLGLAMPPFWFALLLIQFLVFAPRNWFGLDESIFFFVGLHGPGHTGFDLDYLRHLTLPVLALSVQLISSWSRFQRAAMLDVLGSDYIRTARAKGVGERTVLFRHGVRNSLAPLVSVVAIDAGALFGGLIVTESIFSISGMGKLFVDGLTEGDVNVVMAWMMVAASFVILFNFVADLLYGLLDPRVARP